MGQHLSYCKSGSDDEPLPSSSSSYDDVSSFTESERRCQRRCGGLLSGMIVPLKASSNKLLLDDTMSGATASTGESSKLPASPLMPSAAVKTHPRLQCHHHHRGQLHRQQNSQHKKQNNRSRPSSFRYTSTDDRPLVITAMNQVEPQRNHPLREDDKGQDQRSIPVKCPRWKTSSCHSASPTHEHRINALATAGTAENATPPDSSYLERMYDSRTWMMYRRITTHRRESKRESNAATVLNPTCKNHNNNKDTNTNSDATTTMSEPVLFQHVIIDDDQDHSAPTPRNDHFGYCSSDCNGNYSPEWEHMYGDLVDENHHHESTIPVMHESNGAQGQQQHETVFLFDFEEE